MATLKIKESKIKESEQELELLIESASNKDNMLKIMVLSYYRRAKNPNIEELGLCIKKSRRTIYRWLQEYDQGGISKLLGTK